VKRTIWAGISLAAIAVLTACAPIAEAPIEEAGAVYVMPDETLEHEGTWLQWPHDKTYGADFRDGLDPTWVEMTRALVASENVHIVAYDATEQARIEALLEAEGVALDRVDFTLQPTDDVWIRDNGPIYVFDEDDNLAIEGWGFNGWGGKTPFELSREVPSVIAEQQGLDYIDLQDLMINEGGSVVMDGAGTLMATRSSILNDNRNPGMTQAQAEAHFEKYLGVENFIWLDGVAGQEITDMHIDGFATFAPGNKIVTLDDFSLADWGVADADIDTLFGATNASGEPYEFVFTPLTRDNVVTTWGQNLGYPGSYINYYVANTVVLVPNYNDPNDVIANALIQELYPDREVIGIDVRNLYAEGGMVHCVTQQQPR
jgi:agmatine deiminase